MTRYDIDGFSRKKWIYLHNNKLIIDLTKLLETEQNISYALKFQAKFYFVIGKYEEALADLTKLLDFEPNNAFALKYQGETYFMMERYEESLASLSKLSEINANDTWVLKACDEITRK